MPTIIYLLSYITLTLFVVVAICYGMVTYHEHQLHKSDYKRKPKHASEDDEVSLIDRIPTAEQIHLGRDLWRFPYCNEAVENLIQGILRALNLWHSYTTKAEYIFDKTYDEAYLAVRPPKVAEIHICDWVGTSFTVSYSYMHYCWIMKYVANLFEDRGYDVEVVYSKREDVRDLVIRISYDRFKHNYTEIINNNMQDDNPIAIDETDAIDNPER